MIGEQRVVVGSEIHVARRRSSNGINRNADRAAPPVYYARCKGRGEAAAQAVPGDQNRRPFRGCGQKALKTCRSIAHTQNLPESDGGTECDLRGLTGAWNKLIIRYTSDCREVFNPIEPEREITTADANCELAGYAVPGDVGQIAAVYIQRRSPDDLPFLVPCLLETSVDFVDHLLLGGGRVLIDIGERAERHRKLDCCAVIGFRHGSAPYCGVSQKLDQREDQIRLSLARTEVIVLLVFPH